MSSTLLVNEVGMSFQTNENQTMIADMIRKFGKEHILPKMMEWDESQEFPVEVFKKLGDLGLMGVLVPTEYGGSGFSYTEYVTAITELGSICGSIALSMAAHNSLCTGHILQFGNEEQKKKYLPKLATAEWIGAWGLTEANTGSDAMRMQCVAKQDGDYWVLNGTKNWITHGITGNVAVVLARTGELLDSHGITAFRVERTTPGFRGGNKENKLGRTVDLINNPDQLNDVDVAAEAAILYFKSNVQSDAMQRKYGTKDINSFKDQDTALRAIVNIIAGLGNDFNGSDHLRSATKALIRITISPTGVYNIS